MSCGGAQVQWRCGKTGPVSLQKVRLLVRDFGEPCLSHSPIKVSRMLKPEKWQASFDTDGKVLGFERALKSIILGGVDPSIRAEVWEFLLGCYALSSTTEYRSQLRTARRERYNNLVKECQMMHSSIGTGALAYVVGSKVMDMRRTSSKENGRGEAEVEVIKDSVDTSGELVDNCDWSNMCLDASYDCERDSSSDSVELAIVRENADNAAQDLSCFITDSNLHGSDSFEIKEDDEVSNISDSFLDFPSLPVTDLFERRRDEEQETQQNLSLNENKMHSFQINNNADLVIESTDSPSSSVPCHNTSAISIVCCDDHEAIIQSKNLLYENEKVNELRIADIPETSLLNASSSQVRPAAEDRISEWLWTLHRIVVDVVRTDCHLDFYGDTRNLARMSDILAVYAWIDPATGYCQGMSDLLSPFVVLFEDDADAFWCFEMLLRRMRGNFLTEGPTGVMKKLQTLWHILELTDREMFSHLSRIGAESLHFAFRMLMVLFRRELSFSDALLMWEMMWAADFDESVVFDLEENCLEALVLHLSIDSREETGEEFIEVGNGDGSHKAGSVKPRYSYHLSVNTEMKFVSAHTFCGLTRSFWSRTERPHASSAVLSAKNGDDELPVFCVAAVLVMNRHKIIRAARSLDDLIKIFNDNMLKIHVKRCIRTAIKLRKKYFYKLIKSRTLETQNND